MTRWPLFLVTLLLLALPQRVAAWEAEASGPTEAETLPEADVSAGGQSPDSPAEGEEEEAEAEETAEAEYVLGQSALRLELPAAPEVDAGLEAPASGPDGADAQADPPHLDLELALRLPTYDFDGVSFISASRSIITAVLETYCAAGLLFPGEDGFDTGEVLLGAGCLLGATTLYIMGIRKLLHPSEERRARERLVRFEALRDGDGLTDEDVALFENELHAAARRDRRRRIVEAVFGALNIVATATIAGLTARDRIDTTVGTSIATGTAALGVLSLSAIFTRSPSERAWSGYLAR